MLGCRCWDFTSRRCRLFRKTTGAVSIQNCHRRIMWWVLQWYIYILYIYVYMYDEYIHGSKTKKGIPWTINIRLETQYCDWKWLTLFISQNWPKTESEGHQPAIWQNRFCSDEVDSCRSCPFAPQPVLPTSSETWAGEVNGNWVFSSNVHARKKVPCTGLRRTVQQRNRPKGLGCRWFLGIAVHGSKLCVL